MQFTQSEIDAIIESALFFRDSFADPNDPEDVELHKNIDSFIFRLESGMIKQFTRGEFKNICIFLSDFIEKAPKIRNLAVHQELLDHLTAVLLLP